MQNGLSTMHACLHCHASKTACSDCRPCNRCVRLGLNCMSERDQPRKRACKGCHAGKVACEYSTSSSTCNRCLRLGTVCQPRELPSDADGPRKRRRHKPTLVTAPEGDLL